MNFVWRRRDTTPQEDAGAVAIAVATGALVGAASFWLARTLIGRERVELAPPRLEPGASGSGDPAPPVAGIAEEAS